MEKKDDIKGIDIFRIKKVFYEVFYEVRIRKSL